MVERSLCLSLFKKMTAFTAALNLRLTFSSVSFFVTVGSFSLLNLASMLEAPYNSFLLV
jgi:hypothetical protein